MRILMVHPAAEMSISDVSRGYRMALERAGHEVADYHLGRRMEYHRTAMPPHAAADIALLSRQSSENVVVEALYHKAELVVIVSGLNLHPVALWLLSQVNIPSAVVLTESPYEDEHQSNWADLTSVGTTAKVTVFTNDRYSADRFGWYLLSPAFDPSVHYPAEPRDDERCDVLMVASGWRERQAFLEAVNWTGIDLKLYGIWPGLTDNPDSPLHPYYHPMIIDNRYIASIYRSAKICINLHRRNADALTPGPRTYELAACGAFQLSDPRHDMVGLFGTSIPTFDTPEGLESLIRYYLDPTHDEERNQKADAARALVQGQTFDHRVEDLITTVSPLVRA